VFSEVLFMGPQLIPCAYLLKCRLMPFRQFVSHSVQPRLFAGGGRTEEGAERGGEQNAGHTTRGGVREVERSRDYRADAFILPPLFHIRLLNLAYKSISAI